MPGVVVIGARLTVLPFRLAGMRVVAAAAGGAAAAFKNACDDAELVLVTPDCAAALPPGLLAAARRKARPLVMVLPGDTAAAFDVAPEVRRALGVDP